MNKLTAKQLLMINRKWTGADTEATDALMKKLKKIADIPYEQDEQFFYKYKNTVAKASKLGCTIACMKPFQDENTNTAILAMLTLLDLNKIHLVNYENDLEALVSYLEADDMERTCAWIDTYRFRENIIEQTP